MPYLKRDLLPRDLLLLPRIARTVHRIIREEEEEEEEQDHQGGGGVYVSSYNTTMGYRIFHSIRARCCIMKMSYRQPV
jgi:hypothetical protein